MNGKEYQNFLVQRRENHRTSQQDIAWVAFSSKVRQRLGVTLSKPLLFQQKARSLILSQLTPFERSVLSLSQKEWGKVDIAKLAESHVKHGKTSLPARIQGLNAAISASDASKVSQVLLNDLETTVFKKKTVADMLAKSDQPTVSVDTAGVPVVEKVGSPTVITGKGESKKNKSSK